METNEAKVYQQGKDNHNPFADSKKSPSGRVWAGFVLLAVGGVLMAHTLGADIPHWILSWPMILLVVGIYSGAKRNFRPGGWMAVVAVGIVFLLTRINSEWDAGDYFWPMIIITIGLVMIFRPKKQDC